MKLYGLLSMAGLLLAGCLSSPSSLPTGAAEDWDGRNLTYVSADQAVRVPGCQILCTKENLPINPEKIYRLSVEFLLQEQSGSGKTLQAYLGFVMYTKDGKRIWADNIRPRPDTDTILTRPCTKEDTSIYIADGENWSSYASSVVAFNTLLDYQDLPNFQTTSAQQITGIEKLSDGEYRVDLNAPCGFDAAKGSGVRQHQAWDYMYTAGSGDLLPGKWIRLSGVAQGVVQSGMPWNHFGPGIERVGFVILSNWEEQNDENIMLFRNIQLEEVPEEELTPEERAALEQ